jgi:hypothetical protein
VAKKIPKNFEKGLDDDVINFLQRGVELSTGIDEDESRIEAEVHPVAEKLVARYQKLSGEEFETMSPAFRRFLACSIGEIVERTGVADDLEALGDERREQLIWFINIVLMYGMYIGRLGQKGKLKIPGDG